MTEEEINQLAQDYLGYFKYGSDAREQHLKAVPRLWRLCRSDAATAFRVIWVAVNMVDADNMKALSFLGTGPLEDLINFHGEDMLGLMIEAARENANFCVALSCVWKNSIGEAAWQQLEESLHEIRVQHGRAVR